MDVTAFIRELLFSHDCVIVPDFGGFIGNYTPARIDKSADIFYPPVKKISFNRNLNHNDGLLIGKISGSSGINYGDARLLVEEFVAGIRKKLERGEKIVFDKIGSFVNNEEGNVQFEPDQEVNYHLDSYGLEPFNCLPLDGYDVRKRVLRHSDRDPVIRASVRKIIWRAAVIIPLISLLAIIPLKTDIFKAKIETTTMNPLVTAEFENNKLEVDEGSPAESLGKEVKDDDLTADNSVTVTPGHSYVVITGSFKSENNAFLQVKMLRDEGFAPEIVPAGNGFYRVCAIICNDLATAEFKKDSIVKKFPGTWVSRMR